MGGGTVARLALGIRMVATNCSMDACPNENDTCNEKRCYRVELYRSAGPHHCAQLTVNAAELVRHSVPAVAPVFLFFLRQSCSRALRSYQVLRQAGV